MSKNFKIYTKGGDKGQTSLLGGTRVPKYHIRVQAYGTVDELKSYLPLISVHQNDNAVHNAIRHIQEKLFIIEALLASENQNAKTTLQKISLTDIDFLENEIDNMNKELPELKNFIIPGGHIAAIHAHVARCICRRAERIIIELAEKEYVENEILMYFNRLSDYLFVLARFICLKTNHCEENLWLSM